MKIQTDFHMRVQVAAGQSYTEKTRPTIPDLQQARGLERRIQLDKSLNNALSIAQMSQNLILKAMTISHRLRSIASESMVSGNLNRNELRNAISEINSTITQSSAVETVVYPPTLPDPDLPNIREDLTILRNSAGAFEQGRLADMEALATTSASLENKSIRNQELEIRLLGSINITPGSQAEPAPGNLVQETKSQVIKNPGMAMEVQGNISRDFAQRLI